MTEAEATITRCCGPEGCGGNSAGEPERYCIASACMAWRRTQNAPTPQKVKAFDRANWEAAGWFTDGAPDADGRITMRMVQPDDGFCGLAGAPQ